MARARKAASPQFVAVTTSRCRACRKTAWDESKLACGFCGITLEASVRGKRYAKRARRNLRGAASRRQMRHGVPRGHGRKVFRG